MRDVDLLAAGMRPVCAPRGIKRGFGSKTVVMDREVGSSDGNSQDQGQWLVAAYWQMLP